MTMQAKVQPMDCCVKFILRGVGARSAPTPLKINLTQYQGGEGSEWRVNCDRALNRGLTLV
jgi:hypothetical protein